MVIPADYVVVREYLVHATVERPSRSIKIDLHIQWVSDVVDKFTQSNRRGLRNIIYQWKYTKQPTQESR